VVPTTMKSGQGKQELREMIDVVAAKPTASPLHIDYGEMEPMLRRTIDRLSSQTTLATRYPLRWLAIKLMEGDGEVRRLIREHHPDADAFMASVNGLRTAYEERFDEPCEVYIANSRYKAADVIARVCLTLPKSARRPLADKIDAIVCHRLLGPATMVGVIWLLYYLAIVQGYTITNYTWPLLAKLRSLTEVLTPQPGFIEIPLIREFALWIVDSVNALLNYIPIFFILFALIAILEDSGYMPRMAFIMDRLFSRYGLHGQSTLPMVLGGIYVGGCAVPGVMACKGIPDERSRLATILIIPMLNCLAKVPLYVLLINIYFAAHKAWAMFFISTISLLLVLPVSKILTLTVLKDKETAPFVMEMPPYHLPTWRGVLGRAVERVWLFVRKITTIVVAVAVIIFGLLQFPGVDKARMDDYQAQKEKAVAAFMQKIKGTSFGDALDKQRVVELVLYAEAYKDARMGARGEESLAALNAKFEGRDALFFKIVQPGKDKAAKKVGRELKKLAKARKGLLREIRKERIDNSFLGAAGRWLEPVTQWAGFNWRVNVALLSALAAKESSVATLGALYEQEEEGEALEQRMARGESSFTSLHALALMLFMVLYPPCMATTIAVKIQSGSVKWMLFSMAYPMLLGLVAATLVFSLGSAFGLSGLQAMFSFYLLALLFTVFMGFFKNPPIYC
jgi:ferrous iron transport protein B